MLSLPPKVSGVVNGHLVMKVDEVIWSQKPIDGVLAVVMWWGGETSTTFRPVNIARYASIEDTTNVVYEIRTSLALFEKYLRKCGTLRIVVTDAKGVPIGIVRIPEVHNVVHFSPYENYFPIITSAEHRIGDLHVVFQLIKLKQPGLTNLNDKKSTCLNKKGNNAVIIDDTLSNPLLSSCETKHQNAKETTTSKDLGVPRSGGVPSKSKTGEIPARNNYRGRSRETRRTSTCRRDFHKTAVSHSGKSPEKCEVYSKNTNKLSCDDLDDIFSQILERGQKLQKAITLSVIEDEVSGTTHSDPVALMHLHHDPAVAPQTDISKKCCGKSITGDFKPPDKADCPKENHVSYEDKNKVICYLQGKTMTTKEEKEALDVLRQMSPTEGFLHELKDYCMKPVHEKSKIFPEEFLYVDDSSQEDLITQKSVPKQSFKPTATLSGWLPLHRVNCVRLSIIKLVLNAVGFKRVNAPIPSKGKSGVPLPLSGLTFFVEYKWPLSNTSNRPWAENASRFCSKRQVNDEILFNDYASHNVMPLTEQDATNVLITLLGKLAFRVCARQRNQREPILLGEASLTSISDLFHSTSLSQEFLAPVVASDGIFVASLNVRVELGRDRIHFGVRSLSPDQNVARNEKTSDDSDNNSTPRATGGDGHDLAIACTTNTRPEPFTVRPLASSSDEARTGIHKTRLPTGPKEALHKNRLNSSSSVSQQTAGANSAVAKKDSKLIANNKSGFVNHDLAITVQRVSDCHVISGISPQNVHFIIAYRFPYWDAIKCTSIDWQDFSTDPAMCKEELHFFGANRVHSSVLPGSETFHTFLRSALEVNGADPTDGIEFVLFFRSYYPKISDTPTGMALLPLETISTLEAAFVEAAANNAHFTESSCASVIMDLPLQRIRNNLVLANEAPIGVLHLKLDYRHANVGPVEREGSGDSQLDPFTEENVFFDKKILSEDALPHPLKHPWSLPPSIQTVNTVHVPNIAVAIHNIGKIAETYPCSAWLDANAPKDRDGESAPSRRIETVFVTDPSDNFGPNVDPVYRTGEQSKSRRSERHRENQYESSVSEESVPGKSVANAGTRTEEVATCSDLLEGRSIGVQTSPVSGSVDLSVEADDSDAAPVRVGIRQPVKSCNASTSTDIPLQNDRELQTNLPGRATGCQTTTSLMKMPEREEACESIGESRRPHGSVALSSEGESNSQVVEAVTKQSSAESETTPQREEDSDGTSQPTVLGMRDSSKSLEFPDRAMKARSERPSVDVPQPLPEESPRISECERNLLSRKQTAEPSKRRAVTSVVQSRRSTSDRLASETDRGVAGGDKSPVVGAQSRVIRDDFVSVIPCRIEVECALHLPECEHPEENAFTFVTVHTDKAESGQEILRAVEQLITPPVASRRDVHWNWSCQVDLPTALFLEEERRLIFKVWQRKGTPNIPGVLGIAAVDLTVLAAGLPVIDGWFNILDISGNSQGQIKVLVAPQQEASDLLLPRRTSFSERKTSRSFEPVCYYVAQGMFKNFPSHLTNHDDILVQKVQNILGVGNASGHESLKYLDDNSALTDDTALTTKESVSEETSAPDGIVGHKEKLALLKYLEQVGDSSVANTDAGFEISSCGSLRETLAELERLTSKMKERILVADIMDSHSRPKGNDKESVSHGAVPKRKSPLQGKSGKGFQRPSSAQERVHAWDCQSSENFYGSDTSRRSRQPSEINPGDSRSRPQGRFSQYGRRARPLWEHDCDEDDDTIAATRPEDEGLSEWIADAAVREMMNMRLLSQLLFQDIVVAPQVGSSNPREDVKVIELDETNEAKFSDSEELRTASDGTPNKSEDLTASLAGNADGGERLRSPANEADSGVDVDQYSTLSRRNIMDERVVEEHRMGDAQRNSQSEATCSENMQRLDERDSDTQRTGEEQRVSVEERVSMGQTQGQKAHDDQQRSNGGQERRRSSERNSNCVSINSRQQKDDGVPPEDKLLDF